MAPKEKILLLAAFPRDKKPLALDKELSDIQRALCAATKDGHYQVVVETFATSARIGEALRDHRPTIVHFCGHGTKDGLWLEDDYGRSRQASSEGLRELFGLPHVRSHLQCVVLNACHSSKPGEVIHHHVPWVIGMDCAISNLDALAFSETFYKLLASHDINYAFENARAERLVHGTEPVILRPPPDWRQPGFRGWLRRHRPVALAGALAGLTVLIGLGLTIRHNQKGREDTGTSNVGHVSPPKTLPLKLVWLEDKENPEVQRALQDVTALRTYVASRLLPALIDSHVAAIALDFSLDASYSAAGLEAYQEALRKAHSTKPPIPVVALRVDGSGPDLVDPCPPTGPRGACLDLLTAASLSDPPTAIGPVLPENLDSCLRSRPTLAAVLADWLAQMRRQGLSADDGLGTLPADTCKNRRLSWFLYPDEKLPWTELDSGEILAKSPTQRASLLARHVVLIASRDPEKNDLHTFTDPDGRLHEEKPGARLQATAAALIYSSLQGGGHP